MPEHATPDPDTRAVLERLVDELGELERAAWGNDELDRMELRARCSSALRLATEALEAQ
ncbi:MAG TPA: hypothetical protein VGF23_01355 [Gaiellaceae bacterium]|jgi:hypothetical protein